MLQASVFVACSFVGSRTSHVAQLLRQKYWQGTPAVRMSSSKLSFLSPTSLLVLRSVTTREMIGTQFFAPFQEWARFFFPLKNSAYLRTLTFLYSSRSLCWTFHGVFGWDDSVSSKLFGFFIRLVWTWGLGGNRLWRPIGPNRIVDRVLWAMVLSLPCSSDSMRRALFVVTRGEAFGTSLMEEVEDLSMIAFCNQEGKSN